MSEKPEVFWHMMSWGCMSGTILGTLFIMIPGILFITFFVLTGNVTDTEVLETLLFIGFIGFIFGGIPGAILGFTESLYIKRALRDIPEPFTRENMNGRQWAVFPVPIVFSIILSILFTLVDTSFLRFILYWLIFGIPTLIASFASVYVTYRYLLRLQRWSESLYGRKSKAKNEDYYRLMDTAKNDEAITSETEAVHQQKQDS